MKHALRFILLSFALLQAPAMAALTSTAPLASNDNYTLSVQPAKGKK